MYQATGMEAIMKIAFGAQGDFVKEDRIATDSTLFKKVSKVTEASSPNNGFEDSFWVLFQLFPELSFLVIRLFTPMLDGRYNILMILLILY